MSAATTPIATPARTPAGIRGRGQLEQRMVDVHDPLREAFVGYLHRKSGTCRPKTVSSLATRLSHFGRFLGQIDPDPTSLADLDRRRHVEPFITSLLGATNTMTGGPISVADRRIHAASNFLAEITEWGWDDACRGGCSSPPTCPGSSGPCRATCRWTPTAA